MARTDTLEFLSEVVDQLGPLAQMNPGTPLRSAHWNIMVEAVRNLARLAASREQTTTDALDENYARLNHEHTGQIGLSWFDPPTREVLERGISGSVEQKSAVQHVADSLGALRQSVETLRGEVNELRANFDGLRDTDVARRNDLGRLGLRVEALRDVERTVTGFGSRMDSIAIDLTAALDFRRQLVDPAGQPINLAELDQRVRGVESLRENLVTANGQLVRIREFESAIARIETNSVGRDTLDEVLAGRLRDGTLLDEAGLTRNVSDRIKTELNGRFTAIEGGASLLAGELAATRVTLTEQGATVTGMTGRLGQAEGRLGALASLPAQVEGQQTRLATVEAGLQGRAAASEVVALRNQLQGVESTANRADALRQDISQLSDRLTGTESRLAGLDVVSGNLQRAEGRLSAIESDLPGLRVAADLVGRQADQLRELDARLLTSESQLDNMGALPGRVTQMEVQIGELGNWRISADQRLGTVERTLPVAFDQIKTLDSRQTTLEAKSVTFDALPGRLGQLENATGDLASWRITTDQRLDVVDQNLPSALEQLKSQAVQTRQLGTRLNGHDATLDRLASVPERLATVEGQSQELNAWRQSTDLRLDDLSRRNLNLAPLPDRVGALEQSVGDVRNTNTALRTDVIKLNEEVGGVNRQVIQRLSATVDNLNASFNGLESRMRTVEVNRTVIGPT